MARKHKESNKNTQQLNIFDSGIIEEYQNNDSEEFDEELPESNRDANEETIQKEFIFIELFKAAIIKQNSNDAVMIDFAEYVLPNFLKVAIGVTAKGGKWIEEKLATGNLKSDRALHDQSLSTHILNGLFAANIIEQRLEKLDTSIRRYIQEFDRRIGIAGFILHDFEKFDFTRFSEMPQKYLKIDKNYKLSIEEKREIIDVIIRHLQLNYFINPNEPDAYQEYLDDFLAIADNTQTRWGTNWNFSIANGLSPKLYKVNSQKLLSLTGLSCLADRLSSIVKHPQDALNPSINNILHILSDGQLKLTYHSIAENRGVLTNIVNNALIDEFLSFNTSENQYYQPLLYLPTGVIYITTRDAPPVSVENIPERVINKIYDLCKSQILLRCVGVGRDDRKRRIKLAPYISLLLTPSEIIAHLAPKAVFKLSQSLDKLSNSLKEKQQKKQAPQNIDFDLLLFDGKVDRLGKLLSLILSLFTEQKDEIEEKILSHLDLAQYYNDLKAFSTDLKGGTIYRWFYIASRFYETRVGISPDEEIDLIKNLSKELAKILCFETFLNNKNDWHDLKLYIIRNLYSPCFQSKTPEVKSFLTELNRYHSAKILGRKRENVCAMSSSSYTVTEQKETGTLFAPQVYSNRQILFNTQAATRQICSIWSIEMMLRQVLMSQTESVGAEFEEAKYRYLYFYPTYYCTPETNTFLHQAYDQIKQTRFDTGVRNHFISKDSKVNLELERYQSLDIFRIEDKSRKDRAFKLSYPENQSLTFYFMALPPEIKGKDKKPTDTESWIMPAWLAFAFPMILDVKTVVSESPIPPFNDGTEFQETVFLDSAPQAFRVLTKRDRFRLDYILEGWEENGKNYSAPLNSLTAAYAIHLDVNAKQGKGGYDPNWGKFTELAKDFETSSLYLFAYLNEWVRKQKIESPSLNKIKLYTYYFYPCFDPYVTYDAQQEALIVSDKSSLHHPKELTQRYREFYLAKSSKGNPIKANAILKPIDEAASIILNADTAICSGEALVDLVAARLFKLMDRVHSSTAEGRWVLAERDKEREKILEFAYYFVTEVFEKAFQGDRARLAGRQLNIIRDTCEFLYRLENDKQRRQKQQKFDSDSQQTSDEEE